MLDSPQSPISQMLTGSGGKMPMSMPPSAQQPSGLPKPQDPAEPAFQVMIKGLKALAHMVTKLGDAKLGNKVDQMAVDLQREYLARCHAFEKSIEKFQQTTAPPGGNQPLM